MRARGWRPVGYALAAMDTPGEAGKRIVLFVRSLNVGGAERVMLDTVAAPMPPSGPTGSMHQHGPESISDQPPKTEEPMTTSATEREYL